MIGFGGQHYFRVKPSIAQARAPRRRRAAGWISHMLADENPTLALSSHAASSENFSSRLCVTGA